MTEVEAATGNQVPTPVGSIKAEEIGGELLLYHPAQTKAIYLNPSAALIWSLCDGQRPVSEIIALIVENYPEAEDSAAEDVTATIRQLTADGVLTPAG